MIDLKKIEADARKEVAEDMAKQAKDKVKGKLREISAAEKVVRNLRNELQMILEDVGEDI